MKKFQQQNILYKKTKKIENNRKIWRKIKIIQKRVQMRKNKKCNKYGNISDAIVRSGEKR